MYLNIFCAISALGFKTLTLFKWHYVDLSRQLLVMQLYMWPEDGSIAHSLNYSINLHNAKLSYDESQMIFFIHGCNFLVCPSQC